MNEINEEIKITLNLMQTDIDDGTHGELQYHLMSMLEIKRNELQQRLVERSWAGPSIGIAKQVEAPYKSVSMEGLTIEEVMSEPFTIKHLKVTPEFEMAMEGKRALSQEELRSSTWVYLCSNGKKDKDVEKALFNNGIVFHKGFTGSLIGELYYSFDIYSQKCVRVTGEPSSDFKQIHRIGNDFYWSEK